MLAPDPHGAVCGGVNRNRCVGSIRKLHLIIASSIHEHGHAAVFRGKQLEHGTTLDLGNGELRADNTKRSVGGGHRHVPGAILGRRRVDGAASVKGLAGCHGCFHNQTFLRQIFAHHNLHLALGQMHDAIGISVIRSKHRQFGKWRQNQNVFNRKADHGLAAFTGLNHSAKGIGFFINRWHGCAGVRFFDQTYALHVCHAKQRIECRLRWKDRRQCKNAHDSQTRGFFYSHVWAPVSLLPT